MHPHAWKSFGWPALETETRSTVQPVACHPNSILFNQYNTFHNKQSHLILPGHILFSTFPTSRLIVPDLNTNVRLLEEIPTCRLTRISPISAIIGDMLCCPCHRMASHIGAIRVAANLQAYLVLRSPLGAWITLPYVTAELFIRILADHFVGRFVDVGDPE